jgi:ribonuclease HI
MSTNTNTFIKAVCQEKKKQKEATYQLYIIGDVKGEKAGWGYMVVNIKDEKSYKVETNVILNENRMTLYALVEGICSIINSDKKTKTTVECYTDNVYCMNVVNEWLEKWKKDRFINRPNIDLLERLSNLLNECVLNMHYSNVKQNVNGKQILTKLEEIIS